MAKFTMEEHEKRMRELLNPSRNNDLVPRPPGASLIDKLKLAAQNVKSPRVPRV